MDLELNEDQLAVQDALAALLAKHVDIDASVELTESSGFDAPLRIALEESGFLELGLEEEAGWLDAALLVEAVARSGALVVGLAPGDRLVELLGLLLRGVLEVDVVLEVVPVWSIVSLVFASPWRSGWVEGASWSSPSKSNSSVWSILDPTCASCLPGGRLNVVESTG